MKSSLVQWSVYPPVTRVTRVQFPDGEFLFSFSSQRKTLSFYTLPTFKRQHTLQRSFSPTIGNIINLAIFHPSHVQSMRQCHSNKVDRPRHNPDQTVWISDGWLHRMLGCFSGYSVDDLFRFDESSLDKARHDNIDFSSETSNPTIHRQPIPNCLKQTHYNNKTKWTINTTSLGGDVKTSKLSIHTVLSFVHFIVKSMSGHPV